MRRSAFVIAGLVALAIAGCGGSGSGDKSSSAAAGGSGACKGKHLKIAYSMSYVGNDWQIAARNSIEAVAHTAPYKDCVTLDTYVAGADVEKQTQQMQQIVAKGYDAMVVFPISPTALNGAVSQACARNMVVVAFDAEITNKCAYNVHINQTAAGTLTAQWLAKAMGGKGNLVMSNGVPGTSVDTQRVAAAKKVFSTYPGIKIIASVNGMWDQAVSQQTMSRVIASHPKIDGVWGQVGYGNLLAFQAAKRKIPPMTGESENGFRNAIVDGTVNGISYGSPPYTSGYALKMAVAIKNGAKLPKLVNVPLPLNTKEQLKRCTDVTKGCNTFPLEQVPSGFFDDFYDKTLVPELCLPAVRTGQPCPGQKAAEPQTQNPPEDATSRA